MVPNAGIPGPVDCLGNGLRCAGGCGELVSRMARSPIAMGESPAEGRPKKAMLCIRLSFLSFLLFVVCSL